MQFAAERTNTGRNGAEREGENDGEERRGDEEENTEKLERIRGDTRPAAEDISSHLISIGDPFGLFTPAPFKILPINYPAKWAAARGTRSTPGNLSFFDVTSVNARRCPSRGTFVNRPNSVAAVH